MQRLGEDARDPQQSALDDDIQALRLIRLRLRHHRRGRRRPVPPRMRSRGTGASTSGQRRHHGARLIVDYRSSCGGGSSTSTTGTFSAARRWCRTEKANAGRIVNIASVAGKEGNRSARPTGLEGRRVSPSQVARQGADRDRKNCIARRSSRRRTCLMTCLRSAAPWARASDGAAGTAERAAARIVGRPTIARSTGGIRSVWRPRDIRLNSLTRSHRRIEARWMNAT